MTRPGIESRSHRPLANDLFIWPIANKNTVKLSYSWMPNISTEIVRGNSKKLKRNKNTKPLNCNCIKKENCPFKGRCQIECVVYKVEVHNPSSNSNNRNDKKSVCWFNAMPC